MPPPPNKNENGQTNQNIPLCSFRGLLFGSKKLGGACIKGAIGHL